MTLLLVLLFTKHLVLDFLYQPPYQWMNKGTYGHWGGLVHSGQHAVATYFILLVFGWPLVAYGTVVWPTALALSIFEFIVHYHMDWFKMRYNAKKGWKCNTHNEFWILTGIDQWVHSLTYLAIAYWAIPY